MVIQSSELKFSYQETDDFHFPDLKLEASEAALLLGPSGSGKSTLLHLLSGLLKPQAGEIQILGANFGQMTERAKEKFRAQNIGLIFQQSFFLPYLSLKENLLLSARYQGHKVKEEQVLSLFDQLQISQLANKKPGECSLGEQQRASIARALLQKPALILADEPSSALDDKNANKVAELLLSLVEASNSALLVVTHDQRLKSLIPKSYSL